MRQQTADSRQQTADSTHTHTRTQRRRTDTASTTIYHQQRLHLWLRRLRQLRRWCCSWCCHCRRRRRRRRLLLRHHRCSRSRSHSRSHSHLCMTMTNQPDPHLAKALRQGLQQRKWMHSDGRTRTEAWTGRHQAQIHHSSCQPIVRTISSGCSSYGGCGGCSSCDDR